MKKRTKEIIGTTTLAVGTILLSATAFYSSNRKIDKKEDIASEEKIQESYDNAEKQLLFWYSDENCSGYFEQCALDYYEKTGIAVEVQYVEETSYLEQIYDASMEDAEYPDLYLTWNDAKDKAYLYGVATEDSYPVFFDTLVLAYQKENFPEAPASIQEILDYGQNNLLGEGVGNLLEWNVADGFYNYPFVGDSIIWDETEYKLSTEYSEKYNDELTFFKNLSETIEMDTDEMNRTVVLEHFNQGASLCAIVDSDDLGKITADNYGISRLPMLDDTTPMKGISRTGLLLVNEFSEEKDAAADFASFIEKEEAASVLAMTGHHSTDENAAEDETEKIVYEQYQDSQVVPDAANAGEFWSDFGYQMKTLWNGGSLSQE